MQFIHEEEFTTINQGGTVMGYGLLFWFPHGRADGGMMGQEKIDIFVSYRGARNNWYFVSYRGREKIDIFISYSGREKIDIFVSYRGVRNNWYFVSYRGREKIDIFVSYRGQIVMDS
jgi:hypothetical protein